MSLTRTIVVCVVLIVCGVFIHDFLPAVIAFGWHLRHGNSVQFEAWEIPVPWGWREVRFTDYIVVQKTDAGPRDDYAVSQVILGTLNVRGAAIQRDKLKEAMIERNSEYRYISENDLELDGETGFCFNFIRNDPTERVLIDCTFLLHGLSMQYMGTKSRSQVLQSMTQGIRPSK
jgi:hypothetical protein